MAIESRQHGDSIQNPDREVIVRHQRVRVWRDDESSIDGRGQAANGVRVHDGCDGFILENLYIKRCGSGVFATNSDDGQIIACTADRMGAEGFQSGGTKRLVVEDCVSHGHTENTWDGPDLGTSPDRSHGYYFECPGTGWDDSEKGLIMRRCAGYDNDGMGLHLRGAYLLVEDSDFTENHPGTPGGAGDVQLTSARHVIFRRTLLENGDSGITLYMEGPACEDVRLEDCCVWNPAGSFATSAWGNSVMVVQGGVVCGRIDKTRPQFNPPTIYYSTPTTPAQAALDQWLSTYRPTDGTEPPPEPPVTEPPPEGLEEENDALKASMTVIMGELNAAKQCGAELAASLTSASDSLVQMQAHIEVASAEAQQYVP